MAREHSMITQKIINEKVITNYLNEKQKECLKMTWGGLKAGGITRDKAKSPRSVVRIICGIS